MKTLGPISLDHRAIYEEMLAKHPAEISEHSFLNLYAWRAARRIETLDAGRALIPFEARGEALVIFGGPIGDMSLAEASEALAKATDMRVGGIARAPEALAAHLDGGWSALEDRDNSDYVYSRAELAELAGRKFHAKRNLVYQCSSEYDPGYEKITQGNLGEIAEFIDRWCRQRKCGKEPGLCHENLAMKDSVANFASLGVMGAAIRIAGRIEAFTIGERLNEDTAVIHFEKAMPGFKGLYQLVNQWFCQNELSEFEFVNREQDMGVEGLRKAKESYSPVRMVKKFNLFPPGSDLTMPAPNLTERRCGDEGTD